MAKIATEKSAVAIKSRAKNEYPLTRDQLVEFRRIEFGDGACRAFEVKVVEISDDLVNH